MRKEYGVIIGVVGLILFLCMEVWGADWTFLNRQKRGTTFYDAQNIREVSKGVLRVWEKFIPSPEGIEEYVKEFGAKYKNLDHILYLREVDCAEQKIRYLSIVDYDKDGEAIATGTAPTGTTSTETASNWRWVFISPESIGEILLKAVGQ